jgi:hypothetical protein
MAQPEGCAPAETVNLPTDEPKPDLEKGETQDKEMSDDNVAAGDCCLTEDEAADRDSEGDRKCKGADNIEDERGPKPAELPASKVREQGRSDASRSAEDGVDGKLVAAAAAATKRGVKRKLDQPSVSVGAARKKPKTKATTKEERKKKATTKEERKKKEAAEARRLKKGTASDLEDEDGDGNIDGIFGEKKPPTKEEKRKTQLQLKKKLLHPVVDKKQQSRTEKSKETKAEDKRAAKHVRQFLKDEEAGGYIPPPRDSENEDEETRMLRLEANRRTFGTVCRMDLGDGSAELMRQLQEEDDEDARQQELELELARKRLAVAQSTILSKPVCPQHYRECRLPKAEKPCPLPLEDTKDSSSDDDEKSDRASKRKQLPLRFECDICLMLAEDVKIKTSLERSRKKGGWQAKKTDKTRRRAQKEEAKKLQTLRLHAQELKACLRNKDELERRAKQTLQSEPGLASLVSDLQREKHHINVPMFMATFAPVGQLRATFAADGSIFTKEQQKLSRELHSKIAALEDTKKQRAQLKDKQMQLDRELAQVEEYKDEIQRLRREAGHHQKRVEDQKLRIAALEGDVADLREQAELDQQCLREQRKQIADLDKQENNPHEGKPTNCTLERGDDETLCSLNSFIRACVTIKDAELKTPSGTNTCWYPRAVITAQLTSYLASQALERLDAPKTGKLLISLLEQHGCARFHKGDRVIGLRLTSHTGKPVQPSESHRTVSAIKQAQGQDDDDDGLASL